ncbi:PREDICTED: LOW QUALITY PROTEIN: NADPH oxidase activator 1 [Nanorana parkeri]|uniref:LOW QUALITY PROTEIN: NADPH oxidase activator 1 n=1 Tax=Nanorana parkeri TaxID=125878 RepID=UPI00085473F9|nr:PREDICTED: LOW QUALITY PROTEIN: NADPH oxidase activator 1 [Nanorana parkeri]
MPYKDLIKYWHEGVLAVDNDNLDSALQNFLSIEDSTSKIWFNIGCVHVIKGDLENALEAYSQALSKDPCLAVGYFQRSYIYFQLKRYEKALSDCHLALSQLRNNSVIDYKQLGLRHLLFAWEILYNTAVILCYLGQWKSAQEKLNGAVSCLPSELKNAMLESALDQIQKRVLLQPLHIPEIELFRPRKQEVEQLKSKDFLGKPKVISSVVPNDQYSGFEPLRPQKPGFYEPCQEAMQGREAGYHRVLVHYYPENSGDVAVKANSIVYILNKDGEWATAIHDGQKILIPTSFLEPVNAPKADMTKVNNGIPLPPTKMPPTRPNVKPIALDVPKRPAADPTENQEVQRKRNHCQMSARENHMVESRVPPTEKQLPDASLYPRLLKEIKTCPQNSFQKVEMVVNLQSVPQTNQETTAAKQDRMCTLEPVVEEDNLITLQVHTEFTVNLSVRKDIAFTELQHQLRQKLKQHGEQINIQLSYRDSEKKQATPVIGDADLKQMWEQANQKKLILCCKDTYNCVGRPILYHMRAIYQYSPEGPEDLTFNEGHIIDILSEVNGEWLEGHCNGSVGIFPKCFATKLE